MNVDVFQYIGKFIDDPSTFVNFSLTCKAVNRAMKKLVKIKKRQFAKKKIWIDEMGHYTECELLPNGQRHGKFICRWGKESNSSIRMACGYKDGKRHGNFIFRYRNVDFVSCSYNNGVIEYTNEHKLWRKDGKLAQHIYISEGNVLNIKEWNRSGILIRQESLVSKE